MDWLNILTPVIIALVPLLVMVAKRWIPKRMPWVYPLLATGIGAALDAVTQALTLTPAGSSWRGVVLGLAGVGLREIYDQLQKRGGSRKLVKAASRRASLLVVLGLVLVGCGAATVAIQRAEFCLAYADSKAVATVWLGALRQSCRAGKLSADVCSNLETTAEGLTLLDEQARAVIRQADKEIDWAAVGKYTELALKLAAKAAL